MSDAREVVQDNLESIAASRSREPLGCASTR